MAIKGAFDLTVILLRSCPPLLSLLFVQIKLSARLLFLNLLVTGFEKISLIQMHMPFLFFLWCLLS